MYLKHFTQLTLNCSFRKVAALEAFRATLHMSKRSATWNAVSGYHAPEALRQVPGVFGRVDPCHFAWYTTRHCSDLSKHLPRRTPLTPPCALHHRATPAYRSLLMFRTKHASQEKCGCESQKGDKKCCSNVSHDEVSSRSHPRKCFEGALDCIYQRRNQIKQMKLVRHSA